MRSVDPATKTRGQSLGDVAIRGSVLQSAQWLLNKLLTAAATLVIAHWLAPAVYGAGMQALAIYQGIAIPVVLGVGDVLIAERIRAAALEASAARVARFGAACSSIVVVAAIPVVTRLTSTADGHGLGWLLALLATRPLLESWLVQPLSLLRIRMAYPRIAIVDGCVQAGATIASVMMAAAGFGAWAVVAPQVLALGARAAWFRTIAPPSMPGRPRRRAVRVLLRRAVQTASAQHVHSAVNGLEVIMLGWIASQAAAGLFAFALSLAAQANAILAYQLGQVLQPVLSHLQHDARRQADGLLRAQRMLAAVCVPICLAQAIVAEPAFRLLFDERWQPAAPLFSILSLMLGFHVAVGPSMACLRAQGRFRALLAWQLAHLTIAVATLWPAIRHGGAEAAALTSVALWAASAPIGMWLCTWNSGGAMRSCLLVPARAWAVSLPAAIVAWCVCQYALPASRTGDLVACFVAGPATAAIGVASGALLDGQVREALRRVFRLALRRR